MGCSSIADYYLLLLLLSAAVVDPRIKRHQRHEDEDAQVL